MATDHAARRSITSRINKILSDYGVENAVSGGKYDDLRQEVSPSTGYWERSSVISKPTRLIIHLMLEDGAVVAALPADNTNGNFAYANTANRPVGGLSVRILPVIKLTQHEFKPFPDWEWLLWYCFSPKLNRGSSGQLFDGFEPSSGSFTYMGKRQPYIASGLVMLVAGTEPFVDDANSIHITYLQATEAIRNLINANPKFSALSSVNGEEAEPNA
jgi:hypothetical protein